MSEGEPYPDMNENIVLEKLMDIALPLIDCKDTPLYSFSQWGNDLWQIREYLEKRLNEIKSAVTETTDIEPVEEIDFEKLKEEARGQADIVNIFQNVHTINIYNQ